MTGIRARSGQTVSHCCIHEKLGGGGEGVAGKAGDTNLHRCAALGFPPDDVARNAQARERWRREMKKDADQ
ncbi:MAG: hypothetical protein WA211_20350 [Candidatus Acidiferrales bacterium]